MAKVIPIQGLDGDLDKIILELRKATEKRNDLNNFIDILTQIRDIYMQIKVLAATTGFAVKEIEFSEKTISNLDILFNNTRLNDEDKIRFEDEKSLYVNKKRNAQRSVISKTKELEVQLDALEQINKEYNSYLKDKDIITIERIINSLTSFMEALELKSICEKAMNEVDYEEPRRDVYNNEFDSLNNMVSNDMPINDIPVNEIKIDQITNNDEETESSNQTQASNNTPNLFEQNQAVDFSKAPSIDQITPIEPLYQINNNPEPEVPNYNIGTTENIFDSQTENIQPTINPELSQQNLTQPFVEPSQNYAVGDTVNVPGLNVNPAMIQDANEMFDTANAGVIVNQ